jgi:hypothetical protein
MEPWIKHMVLGSDLSPQHDSEARTERQGSPDSVSIRNQSGEWVDVTTAGLKLTITADGRDADDDSITLQERAQRAATLVFGFFDLFLFADVTPRRPLRFARSCCMKSDRPFDNLDQEPKERPESPVHRERQAISLRSPRLGSQLEPPSSQLLFPCVVVGSVNSARGAGGENLFLENGGLLPPQPSAKFAAAKGDAEVVQRRERMLVLAQRRENFQNANHVVLHVY